MSKSVCKFYILNQTCRFGKNCRFSHTQRPPPVSNPKSSPGNQHEESVRLAQNSPAQTQEICNSSESVNPNGAVRETTATRKDSRLKSSSNRRNPDNENEAIRKPDSEQGNSKICRHFSRGGKCYYGSNCHFLHISSDSGSSNLPVRSQEDDVPPRFRRRNLAQQHPVSATATGDDNNVTNTHQDVRARPPLPAQNRVRPKPTIGKSGERKVCPFFQAKKCNRGRYCKFLHTRATSDEKINYQEEGNPQKSKEEQMMKRTNKATILRPGVMRQIFTFAELEEVCVGTLRDGEITTIKKRFPKNKITVITEEQDKCCVRINFSPSDPDWPFDVKVFDLVLTVPEKYPKETLSVKLPTDQIDMPETVRRYVEITIGEWLQDRHASMQAKERAELVFRPFLRWLDRSLEEICTEALKQLKRELVAKAAGMEFLSPAQLQAKLKASASERGDDGEEEESDGDEDLSSEEDSDESEYSESDDEPQTSGLTLDPERKGTQINLRHLQLKENASALLLDRLKVVLQCARCKSHSDVVVQQATVVNVSCGKCHHNQFVHYRPALAHQFSSVAGYLDLDGCQAFDLVLPDCSAIVTCMACSKHTRANGLVSGQMIDGWCNACNAKYRIATEAVKFSQLAPSGVETTNHQKVEVAKPKRTPKDPAIREGCPLPEFGTCKHYKHSYRWLRFPCCGKAYPCDVCHDKKEDHEFIFATRMICGHCCKEQNFAASRPCNTCNQHMTKTRSAHWEGGKGCRDKISMSKSDQQKYRNMTKTLSNHKKLLQSGGKKKTKLRHA